MHALAVSVTIDQGKDQEALEEMRSNVLPRVKETPGLVAGYWMSPGEGHGYAIIVFDSEENANRAREMAEMAPRPDFVKLGTAQVYEVVASV